MRYTPTLSTISLIYLLSSLSVCSLTAQVNRTIDDEHGDSVTGVKPIYTGEWQTSCSTCSITLVNVNVNEAFDGTSHVGTYRAGGPPATVVVSFTGTAVYAFFIIPNAIPDTTTFLNASFELDGAGNAAYEHAPDPASTETAYHKPIYAKTGLTNTNHTLLISAAGSLDSLLLFDYVVYTVEDNDVITASSISSLLPSSLASTSSPTRSTISVVQDPGSLSTHRTTPIGAIVGTVAAVLATLGALLLFLRARRRSNRRRLTPTSTQQDVFQERGQGAPSIQGLPTPLQATGTQGARPVTMSHMDEGGYCSFLLLVCVGVLIFSTPFPTRVNSAKSLNPCMG